ncbi:spore germination protein GerPE [Paenibacillus foliorum]|uniref:spore germination protein GerPE n=1 Tax=Paenibacillus foliorum TaxID=2654974 RepID=UPI001492A4A1|nr:spore germination protein GerPE [Paenibacillus foliorum]
MNNRISSIGTIKINTVGEATVFEVGDSENMAPFNYAIAVQREKAIFLEKEFDFSEYAIFSIPLEAPVIDENVQLMRINESPHIVVNKISVFLVSASAIVHIGSSETLYAQSRIKHIRHLLKERP